MLSICRNPSIKNVFSNKTKINIDTNRYHQHKPYNLKFHNEKPQGHTHYSLTVNEFINNTYNHRVYQFCINRLINQPMCKILAC